MKKITETVLFPKVKLDKTKVSKTISGKTIVITGASYGIGEALALLFSEYNTHLILIARTKEKLEEIAQKIEKNGSSCTIITANLYDENEVKKVITVLENTPKGIDIVVSNAGKSIRRSLADSLNRYHDFTRTNALNYLAPVQLLLALTPMLSKTNGQIINVSAANVLLLPAPKWAAYQASKTAFDQWFRSNLAEWKLMGISAKTIYLPLVRTRMILPTEKYKNHPAMSPEQAAYRIAKLLCSKNHYQKSWWLIFGQIASFFGRNLWERITYLHLIKRK